jgi:hypothetical protein
VMNKYLIILIVLVFIGGNAAFGEVYFSVNAGCDGGAFSLDGGMVYGSDGKTPLSTGSMLQYIYAGANQVPDLPGENGEVGGDDRLISTKSVGDDNVWIFFSDLPGVFYNGVSGKLPGNIKKVKIYVRAWDQAEISEGAYFGNSEVFEAESSRNIMPIPSDITLGSFETNVVY